MKYDLVVALLVSPSFAQSFIKNRLRKLDGEAVEAFEMPSNMNDYAS